MRQAFIDAIVAQQDEADALERKLVTEAGKAHHHDLPRQDRIEQLRDKIYTERSDCVFRLVFADWLEEQGDPLGELIRIEHELPTLPQDPMHAVECYVVHESTFGGRPPRSLGWAGRVNSKHSPLLKSLRAAKRWVEAEVTVVGWEKSDAGHHKHTWAKLKPAVTRRQLLQQKMVELRDQISRDCESRYFWLRSGVVWDRGLIVGVACTSSSLTEALACDPSLFTRWPIRSLSLMDWHGIERSLPPRRAMMMPHLRRLELYDRINDIDGFEWKQLVEMFGCWPDGEPKLTVVA